MLFRSSEKTILELDSAASRSSPEEPDTVRGGAHHPLYLLDKLREGFEHDQVDLLALTEDLSPSQVRRYGLSVGADLTL